MSANRRPVSPIDRFRVYRGGAIAFLFCMVTALAACAFTTANRGNKSAGADLGVEVLSLRRTAAGYMLDLRYRVIDPEKAVPLFDHRNKPQLVHEETGARMIVPTPPKVGALRQTARSGMPVAGRTYFMMFANPGKFIKRGDLVTIVIGDSRLEHLVVQ